MLSCTSSNKLTRGKNQRVPQNLVNPKNGRTLNGVEHWATYPTPEKRKNTSRTNPSNVF